MSVQIVVCDGCGRISNECDILVEFHKLGFTLHLCDECIDVAKKIVDEGRKESDDD